MNHADIKICLLLLNQLVLSLRLNGLNFIPIEDYPEEGLTPEKISAQLGIPINAKPPLNESTYFDFQYNSHQTRRPTANLRQFSESTPSFKKRTTLKQPNDEDDEDVFETSPVTQRKHRTTQQTDAFVESEEPEATTRRATTRRATTRRATTRRTTVHVDNEVKRTTTTPEPFLVDNEVVSQFKSSTKNTETESTQKTTTLPPITQPTTINSYSTTANHFRIGENVIVDGESGDPKSRPITQGPLFPQPRLPITGFGPFNPWILFTTFPPLSQTTPRPAIIDFAPNCLNNAILCKEGGNYERFMRTYCQETCRLYDNAVPHENSDSCIDVASNCVELKSNCYVQSSPYYLLLQNNCKNTCGRCGLTKQTVDPNFPAPQSTPPTLPFIFPTTIPPFGPPPLEPPTRIGPQPRYNGECADVGDCRAFLADCERASMASMLSRYCAATCNFCSSCEDSLGEQ